ncbi:hypothetical protein ACIHCQ_26735 [Streptomyces sp. NPDC052236]|uniref:hypothetical protein n=1 Tax=Streptomyces sp. NPDC052236 TaxID=3365686 RepID=UPI0037CEB662
MPLHLAYRLARGLVGVRAEPRFDHQFRRADDVASFGVATKGEPTKVNGSPAIPLVVTDEADKGGSYTFYVATEGKPYILKVVYKGAEYRSTTSFSAFDKPLDVRPPAKADVLDASGIGR